MSAMRDAHGATLGETTVETKPHHSPIDRLMILLSSVRFGVVLLVLAGAACMVGMLVMQVNVEGFDKYYAELTPSQQLLYGKLGFFDIYHAWYFNALLLVLSLNIVLSSIDNLPKAWTFISRPKLVASRHWLEGQERHAELSVEGDDTASVAARVGSACRALKYAATVTEKDGQTFVFAERGAWNRLGAYAVHVALLVIFAGGFLTSQFGHTGQVALAPGESASEMTETTFGLDGPRQLTVALPFEVECTDIQQQLIDKAGPTSPVNTLDWLTRIRIKDPERGASEALVHMNAPYDYRGYRFFQSSFIPEGKARSITLRVTPEQAGASAEELSLMRDSTARLKDGTLVKFDGFFSDFVLKGSRGDSQSPEYNNPAASLQVVKASGEAARGFAFPPSAAEAGPMMGRAFGGYRFELIDFEKVGAGHVLSVQKDPGAGVVYAGFFLLTATLAAVFMFSHQRVWALVERGEGGRFRLTLGGNTNRNRLGFDDRFRALVGALSQDGDNSNHE
ncbi:MAG TPA: cytochrome c biogenesis protein ResB [Pyrinomonadaceae bacterium]|nr:cytochrome c biogenesis protein ResB [Pyrinomonadaceae bacterium]